MKKFFLSIPLIILFILCGCTGYREIDRGYLVTCMGFSRENGSAKIYIEALSSSDVEDKPSERVVLTSEGSNLELAFKELNRALVKPLYFDQLGSAVATSDFTDETIEFLKDIPNINYGIFILKTDDINILFESETPNGVLGYDLIGLLKTNNTTFNRLYQTKSDDFTVPTISFSDNKLLLNSAGEKK